ncbi:MAG: cytochrome c3 family protein [Planctomycetota bacterium]
MTRTQPVRFDAIDHGRLLAALATACLFASASGCSSASDVHQPIAFVHKVHVAQEEIPCTDCHLGAEDADHATIPGREICLDCHDEALGDSREEAKLVEMLSTGEPIPWKRVHRLEEHVRFSHRRHLVAGQILCETCHGEVPERKLPFVRPFISFNTELGMERCIACHLESGNPRASIDCALCHR